MKNKFTNFCKQLYFSLSSVWPLFLTPSPSLHHKLQKNEVTIEEISAFLSLQETQPSASDWPSGVEINISSQQQYLDPLLSTFCWR